MQILRGESSVNSDEILYCIFCGEEIEDPLGHWMKDCKEKPKEETKH